MVGASTVRKRQLWWQEQLTRVDKEDLLICLGRACEAKEIADEMERDACEIVWVVGTDRRDSA